MLDISPNQIRPIARISLSILIMFTSSHQLLAQTELLVSTNSKPSLVLDPIQHKSMGMVTEMARVVEKVPSSTYPAQAVIPPNSIRQLSSPLSGQISQLNVIFGSVQKGQLIAEIKSSELLDVQEKLLITLSELHIARKNLKRAKTLNQSGVSSTKKLQQAQLEVKKWNLKKARIKQNLLLLGMSEPALQQLEKSQTLQPAILQLKSPIDGLLINTHVKLGERVSANQKIFSLGATTPLSLVSHVPYQSVAGLILEQGEGGSMSESDRVEVLLKNNPGVLINQTLKGHIQYISDMVDPITQTQEVHIQLRNDTGNIRVGQLLNIRFLNRVNETVYEIPANAVSHYQGKPVIYIATANSQSPQSNTTQIHSLPIQIINMLEGKLFFIPLEPVSPPLKVYTRGSTAIKAALAAG